MKKYLFIFIAIIFAISSTLSYAETTPTTGFIPGPIWYSKATIVDGDNIKIHTVVWNGGDKELAVRVEFYDGKTLLGTRDVKVPKGELEDVSISWNVKAGEHSIYARIVSGDVTINETPKNKLSIAVAIKEVDGVPASSADVVKSEVSKITTGIENVLPESVSATVNAKYNSVDSFREHTAIVIKDEKIKTQVEIDTLSSPEVVKDKKPLDATDKPIAYVKLYLLAFAGFVFANKVVFYSLCALLVFLILRFLYRKVRNR
ncbi:MAG: hypothetical protein AAB895_00530 [Patescibacteria group bacterium]